MIISTLEMFIRLVLAAFIGTIVGMEREVNKRPAGRRTHVLVTVGATLVMLVSTQTFSGGDPARLAAQVVSGIGFLGAGTILRTGNSVSGLTTAASLWVCACIGLAIGVGYYAGVIITTIIVMISLLNLGHFKFTSLEKKIFKRKYKFLVIQCKEKKGLIVEISDLITRNGLTIKDIKIFRHNNEEENLEDNLEGNKLIEKLGIEPSDKLIELYFDIENFKDNKGKRIFSQLKIMKGINSVVWGSEEGTVMSFVKNETDYSLN